MRGQDPVREVGLADEREPTRAPADVLLDEQEPRGRDLVDSVAHALVEAGQVEVGRGQVRHVGVGRGEQVVRLVQHVGADDERVRRVPAGQEPPSVLHSLQPSGSLPPKNDRSAATMASSPPPLGYSQAGEPLPWQNPRGWPNTGRSLEQATADLVEVEDHGHPP